ncbi:branched-chain amino acid ABC transporter substrate-binding protein [Variovorax paradoxus]|jgi:branched-chain amino acid transport system substrate-binding protein|uniref:branched-chain amino acid ABC transporter substrate-binding protein n=1 Tax=Variovorax paradoxus TaxID=34073 RepID=UPI0029C88DB8|nr:branched-chain amino acid ABC transporter substrate-binding protein [Variovorax paradoxus]WPH24135.1 branched-chain amino acid ABC transporter substrate-binding protein [Variovorax paradoxus]
MTPTTFTRRHFARIATWAVAGLGLSRQALAQNQKPVLKGQVVKIAVIEPLSGLMGSVGTSLLKSYQYLAEKFNASNPAGVKFEIVGFDNKLSPTETLGALKSAIDQDIRFIAQGTGSAPALALINAIEKHNQRNPGKEVLYLNHAATDPELTGSNCSYWHFRFEADTAMKMEALTSFIKDRASVKKVYLINQNYSSGIQIAEAAKAGLRAKRPDVEIVGDDRHPLAQIRDFSPYMTKVRASGADTIITGSWGTDLSLLIKAAEESGWKGTFYTYYAVVAGTPTALRQVDDNRVFQVAYSHYNMGGQMNVWMKEFQKRFNEDFYTHGVALVFELLSKSIQQAQSAEVIRVAEQMEGAKFKGFNGMVEMRKSDHQLQQPLFVTVWTSVSAQVPYSAEGTGKTFAPVREFTADEVSRPSTCRMARP